MTEARDVAWIGLGKLGGPMAARLVEARHRVRGYDRDQVRREEAAARGVAAAASLADAVGERPVVFSSLPDDAALLAVGLGPAGLVATMARGAILVETSTVSVEASAAIGRVAEAAGIAYLRLPVSGNPTLAETGTLTCFASGPVDAFELVRPLLAAFTRAQTYLGAGEEARYAKLAVNLMIAVSAAMMGETLALARKGGIGWRAMLEVLAESAVASPMVKYKVEPLARRDFAPTFSCRQMAKDLDLILDAGRDADVPMPLAALTRSMYASLIARGEGEDDYIAAVRHVERLAGLGEPT